MSEHNATDWYLAVREFHDAFGHPAPMEPCLEFVRPELRERLMREELEETVAAMKRGDMVEIADGLADLIYVTVGTAIEYGIDLRYVFAEVQRSNMAKLGPDGKPITRADGKSLKPPGWTPPDIAQVLKRMGWEPSSQNEEVGETGG